MSRWSPPRTARRTRPPTMTTASAAAVTPMPNPTADCPSTHRPVMYAMWARRNDASPATKRSRGSIRNKSPRSDSTKAATNHPLTAPSSTSSATATPINNPTVSGLHRYSSDFRRLATAIQSPAAATADRPSRIHTPAFTSSCRHAEGLNARDYCAEWRHEPLWIRASLPLPPIMRRLALFITLAAVATLIVFEAPSAEAYNGAPWFKPSTPYSSDFADPSVVRDGNTYYAFATTTGGAYLPEMTSTDLSTWIAHPAYQQPACVGGNDDPFFNDAFPCPPAWGEDRPVGGRLTKELWAPGPAHIGNNWMVFYAMRVSTNPDRFCIGRAASSTGPLGPYVDNSAGPFVCDSDPVGSIDPQPF